MEALSKDIDDIDDYDEIIEPDNMFDRIISHSMNSSLENKIMSKVEKLLDEKDEKLYEITKKFENMNNNYEIMMKKNLNMFDRYEKLITNLNNEIDLLKDENKKLSITIIEHEKNILNASNEIILLKNDNNDLNVKLKEIIKNNDHIISDVLTLKMFNNVFKKI
jgi:uncharacterized coiled-coil DUF342 family protein